MDTRCCSRTLPSSAASCLIHASILSRMATAAAWNSPSDIPSLDFSLRFFLGGSSTSTCIHCLFPPKLVEGAADTFTFNFSRHSELARRRQDFRLINAHL